MSNQQYQHLLELIELVQQTGDRCLILPSGESKPLVLLTLDSYKELVEKKDNVSKQQIDELAKQLRNILDNSKDINKKIEDQSFYPKKRNNKDETYTNVEEFEIKRRLYADLVDGYKSEPLFQ